MSLIGQFREPSAEFHIFRWYMTHIDSILSLATVSLKAEHASSALLLKREGVRHLHHAMASKSTNEPPKTTLFSPLSSWPHSQPHTTSLCDSSYDEQQLEDFMWMLEGSWVTRWELC